MARPEGFEPPTNGFGSHYSIRLSYGRMSVARARNPKVQRAADAQYSGVGGREPMHPNERPRRLLWERTLCATGLHANGNGRKGMKARQSRTGCAPTKGMGSN